MKYFPEKLTISWLQQSYLAGEVTPLEVAEHIIDKAAAYEDYNIWIQGPDIEKIKQYIQKLPEEPDKLPLWGIPFVIKDNIDLAGEPTTAACPDYAYTPETEVLLYYDDDEILKKVKELLPIMEQRNLASEEDTET